MRYLNGTSDYQYERPRALILLALGRGETKTLQGWADLIGVTTPGAASYHLKALVRRGLIVRPRPGRPELTPAGQEAANLLERILFLKNLDKAP